MATATKTEGGSFWSWQAAWEDMGRTPEEIQAEEERRTAEAAAQFFVKDSGNSRRPLRRRSRTWGKCDENTTRQKNRCAIIAGYFVRAFINEMARPSWGINGRQTMTLKRLYSMAVMRPDGSPCGLFEATSAATRWRDFNRVIEWTANTVRGMTMRGQLTEHSSAIVLAWLEGDADAPMDFPAASPEALAKLYRAQHSQSYSHAASLYSQRNAAHFTDTRARVSFYESKKTLYDNTTPAEAGFSPLTPTPLVGAGAFSYPKGDSDFFSSKGSLDVGNVNGLTGTARNGTESAENAAIPKFTGKLPRRLWWLVWKWRPAFRRLHYGKAVEWSDAHFFSWFKSCLVAGKQCTDLLRLYEEKLTKWHGLASDWRIDGDTCLHPRGLYAELYRSATTLPDYKESLSEPRTRSESWPSDRVF